MTLTTTTARMDYVGTGTTGPFSYTFRILDEDDLEVTRRSSAGVETSLVYPTDFSVTGVRNRSGGTITLTTALAVGETLTIRRVLAIRQATDFRNLGAFLPEVHEDQFDRGIMIDQQLADGIERSLRYPGVGRSGRGERGTPRSDCTIAGFYSANFNALQNTFIGGNIAACTKYGIRIQAGSVNVLSMGFQNAGTDGAQITNGGFDISIANGADDCSTITGCRSESFKLLEAAGYHQTKVDHCNLVPTITRWTALDRDPAQPAHHRRHGRAGRREAVSRHHGRHDRRDPTRLERRRHCRWHRDVDLCRLQHDRLVQRTDRYLLAPLWPPAARGGWRVARPQLGRTLHLQPDRLGKTTYQSGSPGLFQTPRLFQNIVRLGGFGPASGGAVTPYQAQPDSPSANAFFAATQYNLGGAPLLFSAGAFGSAYGDVGFIRGSGSGAARALDTLALIGTLAAPVPTAANTAGSRYDHRGRPGHRDRRQRETPPPRHAGRGRRLQPEHARRCGDDRRGGPRPHHGRHGLQGEGGRQRDDGARGARRRHGGGEYDQGDRELPHPAHESDRRRNARLRAGLRARSGDLVHDPVEQRGGHVEHRVADHGAVAVMEPT
jgi:hypothetical protein